MTDDFSTREKKWYQLSRQEVFEKLSTQAEGLSSHEAALRLESFGPNELREEETTRILQIFLNQIKNPLIYILLSAVAMIDS